MVTEHSISTMVMLSGDQSWNYWNDDEITFGSIKVKLNSTEKMPSYVKRDFTVFNCKVRRYKDSDLFSLTLAQNSFALH